jgi:hypothetical protein
MKIILLLCILLLLFLGCATSSGPLFKEMTQEERSSEPEVEEEAEEDEELEEKVAEETVRAGIYIETEPDNAEVYINDFYRGDSPLFIHEIKAGEYELTIKKRGYESVDRWIEFDGETRMEFTLTLEERTGYLYFDIIPEDALLFVDSAEVAGPIKELQVGRYTVEVKKFGYEEYTTTIEIEDKETTTVTAELEPAAFEVTDFSATRDRFNPNNPGNLGTTALTLEVTNAGSGELIIEDEQGDRVVRHRFPRFDQWEQTYRWDGTDSNGDPVPDGLYTVTLEATAQEGDKTETQTLEVRVDRSTVISYRTMWSGASGQLYTATTDILAQEVLQISTLVLGHVEKINNALTTRFPAQLGMRYGIIDNLEITGQASVILTSTAATPFLASLAGKYRLFSVGKQNSFAMAAHAKATYHTGESKDTLTNFTGISAGFPLEARFHFFHLSLMPEIIIAPREVSYTSAEKEGARVWSYGRAGMLFDFGMITTGISAAFRTEPFRYGFHLQPPISAGWEAHFIIPGTQVAISAAVAGEFSPLAPRDSRDPMPGFYLMGGLGVGFFN